MELTQKEKDLLDIEKFFNDFRDIFSNVTYISLETVRITNERYNLNNKILPICIDIKYEEDKWAFYSFLPISKQSEKIDNAIAYDKNSKEVEYEKVKDIIFNLLPDCLKIKETYKRVGGYSCNTDTIDDLLEPTKRKLVLIKINNDLHHELSLHTEKKKNYKI